MKNFFVSLLKGLLGMTIVIVLVYFGGSWLMEKGKNVDPSQQEPKVSESAASPDCQVLTEPYAFTMGSPMRDRALLEIAEGDDAESKAFMDSFRKTGQIDSTAQVWKSAIESKEARSARKIGTLLRIKPSGEVEKVEDFKESRIVMPLPSPKTNQRGAYLLTVNLVDVSDKENLKVVGEMKQVFSLDDSIATMPGFVFPVSDTDKKNVTAQIRSIAKVCTTE